ncbi:MAG: hypothetical protein JRI96_07455 [Deltaproteobacteria bacterium]|nr:hypothetical protein [Deltaproteobacteria bacterium]
MKKVFVGKIPESIFIEPFIEFYGSKYLQKFKRVDIEFPELSNIYREKVPDCFLVQPKILIEVKRIFHRQSIQSLAAWGSYVRRLEEEVKKRNLNKIKGSYLLNTPSGFRIKPRKVSKVVSQIINAVVASQSEVAIENVGKFKIDKISDEGKKIYFAGLGGEGGFFNPAQIIYENIREQVKSANQQLGFSKFGKVNKKILLLVNEYQLGYRIDNVVEALSFSYKDLFKFKNIDEIWLLYPPREDKILPPILLYSHSFFKQFEKTKVRKSKEAIELFDKWFYFLANKGDEYKERVFSLLKKVVDGKKPYQIFKNKFTRQEMVRLGNYFAEKGRYKEACWIIDKFIDDPDPPISNNYIGDPYFNYHKRIEKGDTISHITTVLGHLAWVIQKLALNQKQISKSLSYTKVLLSHKNLYVKLQAIFPLIEISARRQWLSGYGKRPYAGEYKEFKKIVFYLVDLVAKNPDYKAIADKLPLIFFYFKDLSTKEAEIVINNLVFAKDSAALFIYFGIFRERHYKEQEIEFNGRVFRDKLKAIITSKKKEHKNLRAGIIWHFWKILSDKPSEFGIILPYINIFLKQPYEEHSCRSLGMIIRDWINKKPDVCIDWFKKLLDQISDYLLKKDRQEGVPWLVSTEEVITLIAKQKSGELVSVMGKLVDFWMKNTYIGNPKPLFESYKLVSDVNTREEIKRKFKIYYKSMKKENPRLKEVNWKLT